MDEARRLGRLEAEAVDRALREEERRERETRLARLVVIDDEDLEIAEGAAAGDAEAARLRRDVERLAAFHQAVVRSRSWRILQALRRPFGRAW